MAPNETRTFPSSPISPSKRSRSTSLLIEYTSLGNVVRYQHLIDTYNHSFVALRIMPGEPRAATVPTATAWSENESPVPTNNAQTTTTPGAATSSTIGYDGNAILSPLRLRGRPKNDNVPINDIPNLKYIEFRDSRVDWTNTETPPLERELYDLDADPYELHNLLGNDNPSVVSPGFLAALEAKTKRLLECSGASCRREHATGLDLGFIDYGSDSSAFG